MQIERNYQGTVTTTPTAFTTLFPARNIVITNDGAVSVLVTLPSGRAVTVLAGTASSIPEEKIKSFSIKSESSTSTVEIAVEYDEALDLTAREAVAATQSELDSIQIPTYDTEATVTQEITSMSSSIHESELSSVLGGNTVINILPDAVAGCEANTGWTASSGSIATDNSNEFEGTNCLKPVLGGTSDTYDYDISAMLAAGRYYLLSGYIKNGNATNIKLGLETDDQDISTSVVTATTYNRVGVVIAPTDFDTATTAVLRITVTGTVGQYAYFDALKLEEITAEEYAEGAAVLLLKKPFHLGTKSTDKTRILSVGKNLFDGFLEAGDINLTTGADDTGATVVRTRHIRISANTQYIISGISSGRVWYYDINRNFISTDGAISGTTPSNCSYIRFRFAGSATTDYNIQLERGSTATTYEPYTETQALCPLPLRSVSATIKDEFYANTGEHVQHVGVDSDVSSTQYDSIDASTYTNVDVVKTTAFSLAPAGTSAVDGKTKVIDVNGKTLTEVAAADIDNVASVGKYYYHTDKTVWFIVEADLYADIAAARTGLGTSQVYYQLATPITTYCPSAALVAEPSGTIYVEPFVEDVYVYNASITVDSSYPISSLAYVEKIDVATGQFTPVALSACTVAAGGGSFTISGASNGDYYVVGYRYVNLSTVPTMTYNKGLNLAAQVADNTDMIINLDKRISNVAATEKARTKVVALPLGAVSATTSWVAFAAPNACELTKAKLVTKDAVAASDTDYWTFALTDKGSAGSGTDTIVSKTTKTTGGTAMAAYDMYDLGALDNTHRVLSAGDVVLFTATKSGSATALAEALLVLEYTEL